MYDNDAAGKRQMQSDDNSSPVTWTMWA